MVVDHELNNARPLCLRLLFGVGVHLSCVLRPVLRFEERRHVRKPHTAGHGVSYWGRHFYANFRAAFFGHAGIRSGVPERKMSDELVPV